MAKSLSKNEENPCSIHASALPKSKTQISGTQSITNKYFLQKIFEFSEAHHTSPATKIKNDNKNNGPEDFTEKK